MHKELEVMKPRCKGLWKRCTAIMAGMYFRIFTITPMIAKAADKKKRHNGYRSVGCNRWN